MDRQLLHTNESEVGLGAGFDFVEILSIVPAWPITGADVLPHWPIIDKHPPPRSA